VPNVHIEHFRDEEEEYIYYLSVDGLRIPISEESCSSLRALGISRIPKRFPYFSPEALQDLPLNSEVKNLLSSW
jgi:hypothetical protein